MQPEQLEAAVDATAAALGLNIAAAHRPGVLQFYALAASMAAVVFALPLGHDDEPGAVWRPVEPGAGDGPR